MHRRDANRIRGTLAAAVATAAVAGIAGAGAPAQAQAEPPLPGPPPGAGTGLPLPPASAAEPPAPPSGAPGRIPSAVAGPALADGSAHVAGSGRLRLQVACRVRGRARLSAADLGRGTLAQASYACRGRRATVSLRVPQAAARRLARIGTTVGRVTLRQRDATAHASLLLAGAGRTVAPGDWSDGGLQCFSPGPRQMYLVAPNFTVTPPTSIDVRPWVAWYTADGGWRWLGTRGAGASRWHRLTATPAGVAQWLAPTGAIDPWTWGPLDAPAGASSAVGVFEVVYWYGGRPTYVWHQTRSFLSATTTSTYCDFV